MNEEDLKIEVNNLREYVRKTNPDILSEITVEEIKRLSDLYGQHPWDTICEIYHDIKINQLN